MDTQKPFTQAPSIQALSENTLIILFEQKIDSDVFHQVKDCMEIIQPQFSRYIIDIIPAYCSIHILFNVSKISNQQFCRLLKGSLYSLTKRDTQKPSSKKSNKSGKLIEVPVYYGPEVALDIASIAQAAKLSINEVISLHCDTVYDVYAIGFAPGFAYLGNVDKRIAHPRKPSPRAKVVAGSVGIADTQTAIYPSDSPGGWQIIGRTPISVIDYQQEHLTQFTVGDQVKFISINRAEYLKMGGVFTQESLDKEDDNAAR